MSSSSWSNDDVFEFLDLYRAERIIWDPKHALRKDRKETLNAWDRIESNISLTCSVEDLKKKKESLMATYRDIKRKMSISQEYNASWFAFSFMDSFLGEFYLHNKPDTYQQNLDNDDGDIKDSRNDSSCFVSDNSINFNTSSKEIRKKKRLIPASSYYKNKIYKSITTKPKKENTKRSTIYTHEGNDDTGRLIRIIDKHKHEADEYDLYAQLLVKKLRKLDEHQRDLVMHEIDNIMFRAKLKSTDKKEHRSCSPSPTRKISSPIFIVSHESQSQYDDEAITYEEHM